MLVGTLTIAVTASATPASAQLLERVKERVKQRVEERVGEKVDRAVDRAREAPRLEPVSSGERAASQEAEDSADAARSEPSAPREGANASRQSAKRQREATPPSGEEESSASPTEDAAPRASRTAAEHAKSAETPGVQRDPVIRREALRTGFQDSDLGWLLFLADAERVDRDANVSGGMAKFQQFADRTSKYMGRSEEIASGRIHALEVLREYSPYAVAPPGAVYDARCSAEVTKQMAFVTAVYVLPGGKAPDIGDKSIDQMSEGEQLEAMFKAMETAQDPAYARAIAWYDQQPGMSAGQNGLTAKVTTEDGRIEVYLNAFNAFADEPGCKHLVGPVIRVVAGRIGTAGFEDEANPAAANGLAQALTRARLGEEEMQEVRQRVIEASIDARFGPGFLEQHLSGAALALRKQNRAWFERNRSLLEPVAALYLGQ